MTRWCFEVHSRDSPADMDHEEVLMTQPAAVAQNETPWTQDGEDYGRDLGTGVPEGVVGSGGLERSHQADVPRFYEGPDDPQFPARPEGDDQQETAVAAPPAPPARPTVPTSVLGSPGGQTNQEAGSTPGSEGSNE